MATITVSGIPSDPSFAKAEMISYHLQRNLPYYHVTIKFIQKHDWTQYISSEFKKHGWNTRLSRNRTIKKPESLNQLIFYDSGELIGDTNDYLQHLKKSYGVENTMEEQVLEQIANENTKEQLTIK